MSSKIAQASIRGVSEFSSTGGQSVSYGLCGGDVGALGRRHFDQIALIGKIGYKVVS